MRFLLFLLVSVIGAAASARAADCSNLATQAELTQCAGDNQRVADGQLNAAYKQIHSGSRAIPIRRSC